MIFDYLKNKISRADAPARNSSDVIPDDNNDLAIVSRSIYVGVSGDIAVHMADAKSGARADLSNADWEFIVRAWV